MNKKKVLVVAMLDSIHTARWLSQFQGEEIEFTIMSSKKHKTIHPHLARLLTSSGSAEFKLANFNVFAALSGYLDYLFFSLCQKMTSRNLRLIRLVDIIKRTDFTYIHALEIQGAGYLVDQALRKTKVKTKFILTNWGSDIYYFRSFPEHEIAIKNSLESATHYSAECRRDYLLAKELGFAGIELPCIPNAGGFDLKPFEDQLKASERKNIVAKTYGGDFGRGDLIIESLVPILNKYAEISVFLYSVTDDLLEKVEKLSMSFPGRVKYSSRRALLTRIEMQELFLSSRVYIGASRSDGISTSFLEAIVSGCYPIQTTTSCAGEWAAVGTIATLVGMNSIEIEKAVDEALSNDQLVDLAQASNRKVSKERLSSEIIRPIAVTFYS